MSTMPPNQTPAGPASPDAAKQDELPFDEWLHGLWEKKQNRNFIYGCCLVVILLVLGYYVYQAMAARHEAGIEAAYAAATSTPQLQTFAREHAGHPLANAAYLKLADEAYTSGNFTEAIADYERVAAAMPGTPFAVRALLGKAICQVQSGQTAEGTAGLKQLADDPKQFQSARCEAAYHLATLAFESHNFDDLTKYTDLIMQADPNGAWAQRALMLRARIPVSAPSAAPIAPAQAGAEPTISFKPAGS